jgi:phosphoribosyl 1,2-cyclic phosphodiesterase
MKVRFWGTRGSIPVSLTADEVRAKVIAALRSALGRNLDTPEKISAFLDDELHFDLIGTFGGHSACLEVDTGGSETVILDMGSGARPLGQHLLTRAGGNQPQTYHVFMSHLHWDHLMGFPFFGPAYCPGNRIVIHSCHPATEAAFRQQQSPPFFPVDFSQLAATIEFDLLEPEKSYAIAGLEVRAKSQLHPGDSFAYRLTAGGRSLVYSTDSEHKLDDRAEHDRFVEFFQDADLVVFDAMYSFAESISVKADWGHSSNVVGVELCHAARAQSLCLFHHEPAYDDARIANILQETRHFEEIARQGNPLKIIAAYDGLTIEL